MPMSKAARQQIQEDPTSWTPLRRISSEETGQLNIAANTGGEIAVKEFFAKVVKTMSPPDNIGDYTEPVLSLVRHNRRIWFAVGENPTPMVVKHITKIVPHADTSASHYGTVQIYNSPR